jgi:hypothetical protein
VILADELDSVYGVEDRPNDAPGEEEPFWCTAPIEHAADEDEA